MSAELPQDAGAAFLTALLRWYRANGRDLPWRHTRDPYAIWLSEVILQQTRVSQGTDYWQRFMRRYPTVRALADASEDDVLKLWQGLGYYSRARNLHAAAGQIVGLGHFPTTSKELRQLKGVGDYTAAAVAAFAFGEPVLAVDGNAYRMMSRLWGIATPINRPEGKREFQALAAALMQSVGAGPAAARPDEATPAGEINSAMMDFGATWCTPKSPLCMACPFADRCVALSEGRVDDYPVKERRLKVRTRRLSYIYIRCHGRVAIHQRGAGDIWQGLWEPLLIEAAPLPHFDGRLTPLATAVKHVLTHQILLADFYLLLTDTKPALPDGYIWVGEQELGRYAVPRLVEKLLQMVKRSDGEGDPK